MKNIGLANNGNAAANVLRAKELDAIALAVPSSLAKELRPLASYTAQAFDQVEHVGIDFASRT